MDRKKLVVIGGGAAGFFCAVNAAAGNPDLQVIILEKSNKILSKLRISGGGRCNVTNALSDIAEMSRKYPRGQHFVKKIFHRFFTTDTVHWFEERGVKLKTEKDGRMFPVSDDSQSIVDCLVKEANRYGVDLRLHAEVKGLKAENGKFSLELAGRQQLDADYVCIACGGYPKTAMFQWLRETGHHIEDPLPSLFTFNLPGHSLTRLMGVSVESARLKIAGSKLTEEGPVLITHWGLSGPAVLRLSAWGARELFQKDYAFRVHIHWLPSLSEQEIRESLRQDRNLQATRKISNHQVGPLPHRLWRYLLEESGIPEDMRFADLPARMEQALIRNLVDFVVEVKGKTTFKEEFVTAGGIRLGEVDPNTLMSKKLPNLFFAGEVLDVDGITGGFNFQHAWTSGWIAAQAIAGLSRTAQEGGIS